MERSVSNSYKIYHHFSSYWHSIQVHLQFCPQLSPKISEVNLLLCDTELLSKGSNEDIFDRFLIYLLSLQYLEILVQFHDFILSCLPVLMFIYVIPFFMC